jgi:oligopeptide transport system substrate-binding protein
MPGLGERLSGACARVWLGMVFLAAALISATMPGSGQETTLRRGIGAAPDTLDPGRAELHPSSIVIYDLYEGLLTLGSDGTPIAGAAESWEMSPDGKTYRFRLRANGRWSDGQPVTADDFVYGWRRLAEPKTGSPYAYFVWPILNGKEVSTGKLPPDQLGVEALDERTLKVTLTEPTAYFLAQLSHQSLSPTRPGADGPVPISNGAYMLAEGVPQSHYRLTANPHFHAADRVKIKTVMHMVTENVDTELKRFRAGELDITYTLPITQVDWARMASKDAYQPTPTYSTFYMAFNLTKEPWASNPKLRAALSLAIDREALTEKVLNGDLVPAYTLTPVGKTANYQPPMPSWRGLTQSERDDLARSLFAEAGYGPAGKPLPEIEVLYSNNENNRRVLVAVAAMWKQKLGVQTQLNNQEFRVVASIGNRKAYKDIMFYGWIADFADPVNFLKLLRSDVEQQNLSAYKNPLYDKMLDDSNRALNIEARAKTLAEAEALYLADTPIMPLYHNIRRRLVSPKVKGWTKTPLDQNLTRWLELTP